MAVNISLTDPELFLRLGRAYLETGAPDRALFAYDSALMVKPGLRRPALAHLGRARALWAKGAKRKARKALRKAMSTEPENAEALKLQQEMR
jgi:cytochrome c-type biogenesis protein CcmH/NrfG